jgi:hypothetical protein
MGDAWEMTSRKLQCEPRALRWYRQLSAWEKEMASREHRRAQRAQRAQRVAKSTAQIAQRRERKQKSHLSPASYSIYLAGTSTSSQGNSACSADSKGLASAIAADSRAQHTPRLILCVHGKYSSRLIRFG